MQNEKVYIKEKDFKANPKEINHHCHLTEILIRALSFQKNLKINKCFQSTKVATSLIELQLQKCILAHA